MKRLRRAIAIAVIFFMLIPSIAVFAADTWKQYFPITITNAGAALSSYPVLIGSTGQSMVDAGYMSATGTDTRMKLASTNQKYMLSTTEIATVAGSLSAGGQVTHNLYTGYDPVATTFPVIVGDGGFVTIPYDIGMNLGADFEIEQTGHVDTSAGAVGENLIYKEEAFRTYISGATDITSSISTMTTGITKNILPNAAGAYADITTADPAVDHYLNVDDPVASPDAMATVVYTLNATTLYDVYNLEAPALLGDVQTINSVTVYFRIATLSGDPAEGKAKPRLRLGASETTGTEISTSTTQPTFDTFSEVLARPGGGTWTAADLDTLQAGIGLRSPSGAAWCICTQVYVSINYDYETFTSVTATGIDSGEMTVTTTQVDNTGAGWLAGWDNRIRIDIDADQVDSDLTFFPVLLKLSSSSGIGADDVTAVFDEVGANHLKIAITQADGTTENYVEVEKWDNGAKEAWLWTSIAGWVIDDTVDTTIYLYYDNDHADNTARVGVPNDAVVQNIWDVNYLDTDHLADGVNNASTYDSTSNNNDGTKTGANEPIEAAGRIGKAQDFDGINDKISLGDALDMGTGDFTLECWLYADETAQTVYAGVMGKANTSSGGIIGYSLYFANNNLGARLGNGATNVNALVAYAAYGNVWTHVVAVFDRDGLLTIYLNGVDVVHPDLSGLVAYDQQNANNFGIGFVADVAYLDGLVDEVRVSNTTRSVAWIKANYNTMIDNFVDYIPYDADYMVELEYDLRITVISAGGTVEGRAVGASVSPNANGWVLMKNVMSYMDKYSHTVGALVTEYELSGMITDVTVPDNEVAGNDGTITWGTNDVDLAIVFGEMVSSESAYSTSSATGVGFVLPSSGLFANWFGDAFVGAGLPFHDEFSVYATDSGIPEQTIYLFLIFGIAMFAAVVTTMLTRSMLVGSAFFAAVMVYGVQATIVAGWIVFAFIIMVVGIIFLMNRSAIGG